jgi:fatty acid desaturase
VTHADGPGAGSETLWARLRLECGIVPGLVMPLAILLAATPYLWLVPLAYLTFTVVADEFLNGTATRGRRGGRGRPGRSFMGDFWLLLFGAELLAFLLMAFALVEPAGPVPSLLAAALGVERGGLPALQPLALVATAGLLMAVNFNVSHDLIHRLTSRWRWRYGYLLLVLSADAQLSVSHVYGHHANVGTAEDPSTARRGESIYRFFLRSAVGQYREAWSFEAKRLDRQGHTPLAPQNRVLAGMVATGVICAAIWAGFGPNALLLYLVACFTGKFFYEAAQYIQHYGLVRVPRGRIDARHSWDCRGMASRYFMFNQNNHSHHHLNVGLRCWELQLEEGSVKMPYGYVFMILAAAIPPLWFRMVDPLIDRWIEQRASPDEIEFARTAVPHGVP